MGPSYVIKIVLSSYYKIVCVVICTCESQGGNPIGKALVQKTDFNLKSLISFYSKTKNRSGDAGNCIAIVQLVTFI